MIDPVCFPGDRGARDIPRVPSSQGHSTGDQAQHAGLLGPGRAVWDPGLPWLVPGGGVMRGCAWGRRAGAAVRADAFSRGSA